MSDYNTLAAEVADYLNREDLTSQILKLANRAQVKFERRFNLRYMKARATINLVADTYYYDIPASFKNAMWYKFDYNGYLERIWYLEDDYALDLYDDLPGDTGDPETYSHSTDPSDGVQKFLIRPTPDKSYTSYMAYRKFSDALAVDGSNWLTTNAYEILLYGTLLEFAPFLKNDKRLVTWKAFYDDAVDAIVKMEYDDEMDDTVQFTESAYMDYYHHRVNRRGHYG